MTQTQPQSANDSFLRLGAPSAAIIAFMAQQGFTKSMTDLELKSLAALMVSRVYPPDAIILQEGARSDALYFVYKGAVEVLKEDASEHGQFSIHRIEAGGVFGEMSFMDREPASATVRAAAGCAILCITRDRLSEFKDDAERHIHRKLATSVALAVIHRLRLLSNAHVNALQSELKHVRMRTQFARFFIITLIIFGISSLVQKLINADLPPTQQMAYSWGFLLMTLTPIAYFARRQNAPAATFGLTLVNGWRALAEGLGIGVVLAAVAVLWKLRGMPPGARLVTWGTLGNFSTAQFTVFLLLYGPHCFLQEFIGRGVIQGSLARFMTDSRPIVPILVTSALFGIFHFYVSLSFAILTFVISIVFGQIYSRHGTLLGVTATHFAIGITSIALGFN